MKFYGKRDALIIQDGRDKDTLIVAIFNTSENQDKFRDYIETVAEKLNGMEPFSDEMTEYLRGAEAKVRQAQLAEKFLEEVTF